MEWLVASLVLSIVLTLVLNVALRLFPGEGERAARGLEDMARPRDGEDRGRVRVYAPWKAMIVASIVLTVVVNLFLLGR